MQTYQHYINGQFVDPKAGVWFDTENPYTGEAWAKIPRGDADDVDLRWPRQKRLLTGMGANWPDPARKLLSNLLKSSNAKRCGWRD